MKKYKRLGLLFLICLCAGLLFGCGMGKESGGAKNPYAAVVSMEATPVVDYVVPGLLPNVLIDNKGYAVGDMKTAAVKGKRLPEEFRLVDDATGETVYTGRIEDVVYHGELDLYSGVADFTEYETEGKYFLECDIVGQSHRFVIQKQLYEELFRETYEQLMEKCQQRTLSLSETIGLLEAYEWYTAVFPDENRDEIPDVLAELRGWVAFMEESGADGENRALYAAMLAKFSYLYQKHDLEYATDCLKRASTVFEQVQNSISKGGDAFFALTELYRATGLYTYRKQIEDYAGFFENNSSYLEETEYLYGIMTYVSTRQKVNTDMCAAFLENLMDRAEGISNRYTDMIHPVAAKNNGTKDLLKCAVELSCANYIMNNYQYTKITEEFLHYLMGQNLESASFYAEDENRIGYLLLLAQLAANHLED